MYIRKMVLTLFSPIFLLSGNDELHKTMLYIPASVADVTDAYFNAADPTPSTPTPEMHTYFHQVKDTIMHTKDEVDYLKKEGARRADIDDLRNKITALHSDMYNWQERLTNFFRREPKEQTYRVKVECNGEPISVRGNVRPHEDGADLHLHVRPLYPKIHHHRESSQQNGFWDAVWKFCAVSWIVSLFCLRR